MARVLRFPLLQARVFEPGCGESRAGRGQLGGGGGGSRCCSLARRAHGGSGDRRSSQAAFLVARYLGHCPQRVPPGSLTILEALGGVPGAERDRRPPPKHEEGVRLEPLKIPG